MGPLKMWHLTLQRSINVCSLLSLLIEKNVINQKKKIRNLPETYLTIHE